MEGVRAQCPSLNSVITQSAKETGMAVGTSPGSSFLMPSEDERTELQLELHPLHTVVPVHRAAGNDIGWIRDDTRVLRQALEGSILEDIDVLVSMLAANPSWAVMLNIFLTGMDPFYFHVVNVILHCLVTLVLMYTCDKTVFKNRRLAFVTALLFAVHPVHTEATSDTLAKTSAQQGTEQAFNVRTVVWPHEEPVAGIVGRADVLACLLFLLAFLSYHRSLDQGCAEQSFPPTASPFFLLLSLFLGTCAMLVKETGVTVFGVCLVYDLFSPSHKQDKLSNGVICQHSPQQPGSAQPSSQHAHPHRERGKQRVPHRDAWGGCHSPLPPEPKSSGFSVSPGAVWSLMSCEGQVGKLACIQALKCGYTGGSEQNVLNASTPYYITRITVMDLRDIFLCIFNNRERSNFRQQCRKADPDLPSSFLLPVT
ncbi:hypothetical protein U0070_005002 [Myodes glareolus]|uniref:Uncharacterized protein n=1 Tax=Myodes glareolus TaxID=447135 RepID=A0AAW0K7H1_MYOGA